MAEAPICAAEVMAKKRWDRYRERMDLDPEFPPLAPWEKLNPETRTLRIDDERTALRALAETNLSSIAKKAQVAETAFKRGVLAAAAEGEKP